MSSTAVNFAARVYPKALVFYKSAIQFVLHQPVAWFSTKDSALFVSAERP